MNRYLIMLCLLLSSCTPASGVNEAATRAVETHVARATDTPAPTITPTAAPRPTSTPVPPTPTSEPPAILSKYLVDPIVLQTTTFDSLPVYADVNPELVAVQNGQLQMRGQDYQGGFDLQSKFSEGQGLIYSFKIQPDSAGLKFEFETYLDKGTWWTPEYRRFGVYIMAAPEADMWLGRNGTGKYLSGELKLVPDTWYQMLLVVGKGAEFLGVISDPNNPGLVRSYRVPKGGDWSGLQWTFFINGAKGTMLVDDLMKISFSGIK